MGQNPNIRIRGVRQTIPPGYVLARTSKGDGPVELVSLRSLGIGLVNSGSVAAPDIDLLSTLGDVTLTSPVNGQFLKYNGSVWINATVTIPSTLDDLSDVTITTPSNGQFLKYNGSAWVNASVSVPSTLDDLSDVTITSVASGQIVKWNGSAWVNVDNLAAITFVIDGAGSTIATGIVGDLSIPFDCTIVSNRLLADQSGSIVVNIWKDTYANYPPTVADKITASAPPTISSATKSEDTTLTGWTTTITAGDTLRFNVDSVTTIQRVTLTLKVKKT